MLQTACGGLELIADIQVAWTDDMRGRLGAAGGWVWVDSAPGPGTVVHGQIPITENHGGLPEPLTERQNRVPRLLRGPLSLPENAAEL